MLADFKKNRKGFAALYITLLIMMIIFSIGASITFLVLGQQKIAQNIVKSTQAYYTAESGIEDALLRLSNKMAWSSPYNFTVGSGTANVSISELIGGTRTIISSGNIENRIRKVQAIYEITTEQVSFFYGAQIGDGGMTLGNNKSKVIGNVFSNGNVTGAGSITNNITIAGNGHKIDGPTVGGDATVHSCYNSAITGTLYYVSGGSRVNCTYGAAVDRGPNEIDPVALPISDTQINSWKTEAAKGGVASNDVTVSGTESLGPIQVGTSLAPKNLIISNNAILNVTGNIYVTGTITTGSASGTTIRLDSSYGSSSGVVIADGSITINNNVNLLGSGQAGSYILVLSTKSGANAISVGNNSVGAIFYTSAGGITLNNNMKAREITGYQVTLGNNAEIQYESGLESATFGSGPGGSWKVSSWKEIE
jgi:Tfp pilus assembly protein PilX